MIDANAIIKAALLANSPLVALTGQRIWPGLNLPAEGYVPSQGGAISFRVRGGNVLYNNALQFPSYQFKCYGLTEVVANNVYRALFDALRYPTGGIRSASVDVLGQPVEDENGWKFVLGFWTIWVRV